MAETIKRYAPNSSSIPVLKLGISTTSNLIFMFIVVMLITIFTGDLLKGIVAVIAFCGLRYFSGGLHIRSVDICNVISALFVLISVYLPIIYWYNGFVINILTVVLLAWNAPFGIKRSKLPPKYYPVLKLISVAIVSVNFVVHSPLLTTVFFTQALTTLPAFSAFLKRMNW